MGKGTSDESWKGLDWASIGAAQMIPKKRKVFSFFRPDSSARNFSEIRLKLELGIFQITLKLETCSFFKVD